MKEETRESMDEFCGARARTHVSTLTGLFTTLQCLLIPLQSWIESVIEGSRVSVLLDANELKLALRAVLSFRGKK